MDQKQSQRHHTGGASASTRWPSLLGPIWLAVGVGVTYFLAAQLSLALLTKPDGVAVFWPAAGIASGTLIALGSRARLPVAVGVAIATIAANLLGDRNLAAGVVFALCNIAEALLVAWLIRRHFGPDFRLESLRAVLGFFGAAAAAPALSGLAATAGFIKFYGSDASVLAIWLNWFASDALGIVMVAPLLIGLAELQHDLPQRWELSVGTLTLAALVIVSAVAFGSPAHHWYTALPLGLLLPVVLAAYCRPVFAAGAALVLAFAVVWTTTFGIGELGELPSLHDRAYAGRATLLAISTYTLVLAALFAERRHKESALEESNGRLQLALDCAELGTWRLNLRSGQFENDMRDRRNHGHEPSAPPQTLAQMRSQIHPGDLANLDGVFAGAGSAGGSCRIEYRLAPCTEQERAGRERWVAVEGAVVRDGGGRPVQLLGVTRDITERKHTEARLQESERALRDLLGALPAAIFVTDAAGRITFCNERAVDLWGARPKLGEDRWSDMGRFYHADGAPMGLEDCPTEIALKQGRAVRGSEAILERADGTRIPVAPYPTPLRDRTGTLIGVVNMTVDISERKQAEQVLAERNAQLALAGKFARVGTFTFNVDQERMQVSPGYAAIHGLREGTEEIRRDDWRRAVHPEDLPGVEARFRQTMADRRREHYCEYRIVRSGGEIRWIDSRSLIAYDGDGAARVIGANIDVTQRKQTEAVLEEHEAILADALAAGQVMAFDWDAVTGRSRRSDNAALMLGIEDEPRGGPLRNEFLTRIHPDDRPSVKKQVRGLSRSNPSYALVFRFCRPNGEHVWLEETAKGEFDPAGRLLRIKGLTRNITARKNAELVLEERNVLLALAGKAAGVGSYAYDLDADAMQISEGYAALHGLPEGRTETTRSEWLVRVHPEDAARVVETRRRAFRQRLREYGVEYRISPSGDEVRWIESRSFISYGADGHPLRVLGVNIDVTDRRRAEDHQRLLVAELDHRVKNMLATVAAIIAQTQEGNTSLADFIAALHLRVRSLSRTHELLSQSRWSGVSLRDIARREFAPYGVGNVEIGGPNVTLKAEAAQALAMVLHELTTNAAKYGAFSGRSGRVLLRWRWLRNGSRGRLAIEWQEVGGPPVRAPSQTGYGTSVIKELVPFELDGKVDLAFAVEGVRCRIEIPQEWVGKGNSRSHDLVASTQGGARYTKTPGSTVC